MIMLLFSFGQYVLLLRYFYILLTFDGSGFCGPLNFWPENEKIQYKLCLVAGLR